MGIIGGRMRKVWTFEVKIDTLWFGDEYGYELESLGPTEATKIIKNDLKTVIDEAFQINYLTKCDSELDSELDFLTMKKLEVMT